MMENFKETPFPVREGECLKEGRFVYPCGTLLSFNLSRESREQKSVNEKEDILL